MSYRLALRAPLLALALTSSAWAESNLILNGSLDRGAGAPPADSTGMVHIGSVNSTAITNWTITEGTVDLVPTGYWDAPAGMAYSLDLIGTPGESTTVNSGGLTAAAAPASTSQLGQISQQVSTVAGDTYQLTFDMSVNPLTSPLREYASIKRLLVEAVWTNGQTERVLASRTYELARGTRHADNMEWLADTQVDSAHEPFTFKADGNTTIRFTALMPLNLPSNATDSTVYCGPALANVGLTLLGGGEPVPEPASLGLLGVGVSALLLRRRRGR